MDVKPLNTNVKFLGTSPKKFNLKQGMQHALTHPSSQGCPMAIFQMSPDVLRRLTSKPYQTQNSDPTVLSAYEDLINSLHT